MDLDKLIVNGPNTDLVNSDKAADYMDSVRKHLPEGMEDQFFIAGLSEIVSAYVGNCFMTDVDPKECAETIVKKLGAKVEA